MGYLHIENLYRNQDVLMFREVYAMEKIHGTSAHIGFHMGPTGTGIIDPKLNFFSGGEKHEKFVKIFNEPALLESFAKFGMDEVIVFGEAYGGSCQGMKDTYGASLKFIAFDVKIGDHWLPVHKAEKVALELGFDFVHYVRVPATVEALDIERDKPSTQAMRNGCGADKKSEGVVIRPLVELRTNNGERLIAKHKRAEFRETTTTREVKSPEKLVKLENARAIAEEWVTDMRLTHVLDKMPEEKRTIENMRDIISAMVEDVLREASGEIIDGKDVHSAIGHRTVKLFKASLNRNIRPEAE